MDQGDIAALKKLTTFTRWATRSLYMYIAAVVCVFAADYMDIQLFLDLSAERIPYTEIDSAVETNELRVAIAGAAMLITFGLAGVFILLWKYNANKGARQLGALGMQFSPGRAVAHYFIPFSNLYRPYEAMSEIYRASQDPERWAESAHPKIVGLWWTLSFASGLLSRATEYAWKHYESSNSYTWALTATFATDAVLIGMSLAMMAIVRNVFNMQVTKFRRRIGPSADLQI